jgi:TP901 family phage tail tape measure protein
VADRVVKVTLQMVTAGYMQGADAAAKKTRELGSEAEKLAQKREAFTLLGTAALGFGAALSVGVGMAVSKFAEFDQQMSYVQAATHETAGNMSLLRQASLDAGAATVFSATEAAQAVEELSKAGISTADILAGGLTGSMDLAAAGGLGVARAAEISATALQQFGLEGSQASHVADVLAAGAGKAMGSVEDLANGLKFVGPIAASMGVSIEETTGALALFAQQGIIGEQAGTSLRGVLSSLTSPSKMASKEIERLGITLYDSQGNFLGLENAAGELSKAYSGMTGQARDASLGLIFGNQQITAATALYRGGAEGVAEWTKAVDDSGYASETAAMRLDNLKGDLEALSGAFDTAMISMGEGADGPLRGFVQQLTGMVDAFNDLPDWAQQSTLGIGALAAAVALGSGTFLLAVPKVAAYNSAIATMGVGAQRASRLVGLLGKAAGAGALLYGLAASASKAAEALGMMGEGAKSAEQTTKLLLDLDFDGMFKGLSAGTSGVRDLKSAADALLGSDAGTAFNRWGSDAFAFTQLPSSVGKAREQFGVLSDSLAELVRGGNSDLAKQQFEELAAQMKDLGYSTEQTKELLPSYTDALTGVENASKLAGSATDGAAGDIASMGDAAAEAQDQVDGLRDALLNVGRTALDMGDAQDQAQSAMNKMAEAAKAADVTLNGTNDASIAFRDSQRNVEEAAREVAASMLENGKSSDEATAAYKRSRDAILDQIQPYFDSREAAAEWADKTLGSASDAEQGIRDFSEALTQIPEPKPVQLSVNTSEASRGLNQWITTNSGRVIRVKIAADGASFDINSYGRTVSNNATGNLYEKGKVKDFAAGGWSSGVGMAKATPGGLLRVAEAGYDEAIVSTDPKYRDRSINIMQDMAGRLGMWQQPSLSAMPVGGTSQQSTFNNTQNINVPQGMSPAQVGDIAAERFGRALRGA